jgi:hypothetical protein
MKFIFSFILLSVLSSCELEADEFRGIESRLEKTQINENQITNIEKLKEIYGGKELVNSDSLFNDKFFKSTEPEYVVSTSQTQEKTTNISISKENCNQLGYAKLSFSFEAPPEYSIEYFPVNGGLVNLKFEKENTLISELSFTTIQFDKNYTLKKYKDDFNEFTNDEANKKIKVSLLNSHYFGKQNINTLMQYSGEETPYNNKSLSSLGMMIPSLDSHLFLMCSLTKPNINTNHPFSKLEEKIFNTLVINAVPIDEIIESYN